jgi:sulfhydrogenase subunit beta (sulfur reductase)
MALRVVDKAALPTLVNALLADQKVVGPTPRHGKFAFDEIKSPDELVLDYPTTILPPKEWLLPRREKLFDFRLGPTPELTPAVQAEPVVLFGLHPCDIAGIECLDAVMAEGNPDPYYLARRAQASIVGVDCSPDEYCYCRFTGTATATSGYDVFLTDIGDAYVADAATDVGRTLIEKVDTVPAQAPHIAAIKEQQSKKAQATECTLDTDIRLLPLIMTNAMGSKVWEKHAEPCFSCGACSLVCPTCYCFDVADEMNLDLTTGSRVRSADVCMLAPFAKVASGENFRAHRHSRLLHRIERKFHYQYVKYGRPHCTGCGRCRRACVAGIDQLEVIADLLAEQAEGVPHGR